MHDDGQHGPFVDAWLARSPKNPSPQAALELLERGFKATLTAARRTLGDLTLAAIADRVLIETAQRFAFSSSITMKVEGELDFAELRDNLESIPPLQLNQCTRFILVELLTVFGNLTAEILTPELHAELSKVASQSPSAFEPEARSNPVSPGNLAVGDRKS